VAVTEKPEGWTFAPAAKRERKGTAAMLFFPGGGVEPAAYGPLLRKVAEKGGTVVLVKLPAEKAAPETHRKNAIAHGEAALKSGPEIARWAAAGHSMGATVAARFVFEQPAKFAGLAIVGSTHPRDWDLSGYKGETLKIQATADGVARLAQSEANRKLLPPGTTWVKIEGGNHAQFGSYGTQFGDRNATISAEQQRQMTAEALAGWLKRCGEKSKIEGR
jgi:pimeloyl-ACP methyl ester carboxylesterase